MYIPESVSILFQNQVCSLLEEEQVVLTTNIMLLYYCSKEIESLLLCRGPEFL